MTWSSLVLIAFRKLRGVPGPARITNYARRLLVHCEFELAVLTRHTNGTLRRGSSFLSAGNRS
ncbi:hypothetical protein FFLO_07210 [Filobasidium floriforme]|uniref:Uncharacterized protein n=1 Tax=Filobasidium floriforme TaxID=5210 RepID=A0A8K0JES4_9TREE|nr:hypothetical protein FFLO_07210 [Filobasidium floriforme]